MGEESEEWKNFLYPGESSRLTAAYTMSRRVGADLSAPYECCYAIEVAAVFLT